jgi:hypothetical protein
LNTGALMQTRNLAIRIAMRIAIQLGIILLLLSSNATAQTITTAHYADAVERYGHFALGRPHEYARLIATTSSGERFDLQLPADEVFEDLAPRVVQLAADESPVLLTIISNRHTGARLALIRLSEQGLVISAQSAPIGSPMRWLNPVGVADLDGDGRAEIAAVITPHIGGKLKVYRQRGETLVEIAELAGFSNHVYRSSQLALSMPLAIDGRMRLLVPDFTRSSLRIIALKGGELKELGRCALDTPITGAISAISPQQLSISSSSGGQLITLADCAN